MSCLHHASALSRRFCAMHLQELLTLYGEEYQREYPSPFGWMEPETVATFREFW